MLFLTSIYNLSSHFRNYKHQIEERGLHCILEENISNCTKDVHTFTEESSNLF